jgi:HSP20 family protein
MRMTDKNTESRRQEDSDTTSLPIPSLGLPRVFEDFMRPFDEFMEPFFPSSIRPMWTELRGREPTIDFQDRGDHYVLTAELPGFEKKDVEVKISSNVLELKGERTSESKSKKGEQAQTQSSHSYVHRYMTLPQEVLSEKVSGTMKNGVLELKLPKREPKALDKSKRVDLK